MNIPSFSKQELDILQDASILLAKVSAMDKILIMMNELRMKLQNSPIFKEFIFDDAINIVNGKISKGENHQNLPYAVLDFPTYFSQEDLFVFRTIFWWGNEFSFSLLLKGMYKDIYAKRLIKQLPILAQNDFYWCINSNLWQHDFSETNYQAIKTIEQEIAQFNTKQLDFIKISRKLPIHQWKQFTNYGIETYEILLSTL